MMPEVLRVLVIEDDFLVAELISGLVEQLGHSVVGRTNSGESGVDLARAKRPDVILLDLRLPGMGGVETARQLQLQCPTPIVVLTAYNDPEMIADTAAAGVGAYLLKPPKAEELERSIIIAIARFEDLQAMHRLNTELSQRNSELEDALAQVKTLTGLIPICSSCKKIRDDDGYWLAVETFITQRTESEFSHGICPSCMTNLYGDILDEDPKTPTA